MSKSGLWIWMISMSVCACILLLGGCKTLDGKRNEADGSSQREDVREDLERQLTERLSILQLHTFVYGLPDDTRYLPSSLSDLLAHLPKDYDYDPNRFQEDCTNPFDGSSIRYLPGEVLSELARPGARINGLKLVDDEYVLFYAGVDEEFFYITNHEYIRRLPRTEFEALKQRSAELLRSAVEEGRGQEPF